MDSVQCSAPAGAVSITSSPVASQLYPPLDHHQFSCGPTALQNTQHAGVTPGGLSVVPPQCVDTPPPHFQLHLPRPPPPPQVQPLPTYPQHSGGSATPGLGMLYNPALVKRETAAVAPRSTRDVRDVGSGVVGGWHTMSPAGVGGYRDSRRLVQPITASSRHHSSALAISSQSLHQQHELSTRSITNNNHDSTSDRKKSRRSGTITFQLL